jgi:hypothetical protein
MISSSRGRLAAALLALSLALPSVALAQQPSAADMETARQLYKQGRELKAKGDLKGALEKLLAAHAVGRTPLTGIELARVEVELGMVVEAREVCLSIARTPVASDESKRSADARVAAAALAEELKAKVATIVIRLVGTAPGDKVTLAIDGIIIPDVALAEPRKVDPGRHSLAAHLEGGEDARVSVDVTAAETKEVTLAPPPAPVVAQAPVKPVDQSSIVTQPPSPPERHPVSNAFAVTGFAVGSVGVIVGAVTGAFAIAAKGQLTNECIGALHCLPGSYDKLDSARAEAAVSTGAFIVGGVGLLVGALALALRGHGSSRERGHTVMVVPVLGVGTVGAAGAF